MNNPWPQFSVHNVEFYSLGNYEEGFGKERYKNKWNGPNSTMEINANGQMTVTAKNASAVSGGQQLSSSEVNDSTAAVDTGNSSN